MQAVLRIWSLHLAWTSSVIGEAAPSCELGLVLAAGRTGECWLVVSVVRTGGEWAAVSPKASSVSSEEDMSHLTGYTRSSLGGAELVDGSGNQGNPLADTVVTLNSTPLCQSPP